MKKIICLFGIIGIMLLTITNIIIVSANKNDDEEVANEYDLYVERNTHLAELSSKLQARFYEHYGIKKLYEDEYPEYYGGIYINDDATALIIQIVKDELPLKETEDYEFLKELINMDNSIQIEYVENSFNKLISLNNSVATYMSKNNSNNNVAGGYIDVIDNTAVVEVLDNSNNKKKETINNIFNSNVNVQLDDNLNIDGVKIVRGEFANAFTNINAGGKITIPELGSCSMGYRVKYNGKNGFITAGHCVDLYDPTVGETKKYHLVDNTDFDYAFVETYSNYTPTNKLEYPGPNITKLAVPNYCPYITVNMEVAKSGITTEYTTGKVKGLDQSLFYANQAVTVTGLVKTNVKSDSGDSGAPVFMPIKDSEGGAVVVGVLNGGTKGFLGIGRYMYFTSFDSLPLDLQIRY